VSPGPIVREWIRTCLVERPGGRFIFEKQPGARHGAPRGRLDGVARACRLPAGGSELLGQGGGALCSSPRPSSFRGRSRSSAGQTVCGGCWGRSVRTNFRTARRSALRRRCVRGACPATRARGAIFGASSAPTAAITVTIEAEEKSHIALTGGRHPRRHFAHSQATEVAGSRTSPPPSSCRRRAARCDPGLRCREVLPGCWCKAARWGCG